MPTGPGMLALTPSPGVASPAVSGPKPPAPTPHIAQLSTEAVIPSPQNQSPYLSAEAAAPEGTSFIPWAFYHCMKAHSLHPKANPVQLPGIQFRLQACFNHM